ncbi:MAG: hypothetical protein WCK65_00850 [Rhodospirillaceae bacterium]
MGGGHTVAIGDRFVRAGQANKVFVVTRIDQRPHHPPHARLKASTPHDDQITIAVATLGDARYFLPVPDQGSSV